MTIEAALLGGVHTDPAVREILERLPDSNYPVNYQPEYPDLAALGDAIGQMRDITPVTTPGQIMGLRNSLSRLVDPGKACDPLIILGYCAEPIDLDVSAEERAADSLKTYEMIKRVVGDRTIYVPRERGQYGKPRSAQFQKLPDGSAIVSYMGDSINGIAATDGAREPNPLRLVAGARQAAEFEAALTARLGRHLPASHEALSLAYEEPFVSEYEGRQYGRSADIPWIGERTRQLDGPHIALARRLRNPIGVKLGPSTTPGYLEGLQQTLNPANEAGRLVLMVRAGNDIDALERIAKGIKAHNPNAAIIYDPHGSTEILEDGSKHRSVERTVADIEALHRACGNVSLRMHGVLLEMAPVDNLHQCTDSRSQHPTEAPKVDPLFSRQQVASILLRTRDLLPRAV